MWWPEDWPATPGKVTWHGSADELASLHRAVCHHCACRFDEITGGLRTPCRAHTLLADQSALDHLVHVRRMRAWFVANEMDAACLRQTVGGVASVPLVRADAPCPVPARRRHLAALPPEVLGNLEALYEAPPSAGTVARVPRARRRQHG